MQGLIELRHEDDQSITVWIDLDEYVTLFLKINEKHMLHEEEQAMFSEMHQHFIAYFLGMGVENDLENIKEGLLSYYQGTSLGEQIRQSFIFDVLIHHMYAELLKNAIDAFLEQRFHLFKSHEVLYERSFNVLCFNLCLELSEADVKLVFSDSGPGFSEEMLTCLLSNQAQYTQQFFQSHKRGDVDRVGLQGLLGGAGRGLKEVMALVLKGCPLPSSLYFSNGAHIKYPGANITVRVPWNTPSAALTEEPYRLHSFFNARATSSPLCLCNDVDTICLDSLER